MRSLGAVLALLMVGAIVGAQEAAPVDPGRQAFEAGVAAYNAGNFDEAKAKFVAALDTYQGDATVLTWLGTACYSLRQWDEAIDYLTQATQAKPDYAVAFNNLGNAYLEKGGSLLKEDATAAEGRDVVGKAIAAYTKAIALDANYFYPVYNLALGYTAVRDWNLAWKYFTQATKLKADDPDVWRSFGRALKQAGELDKAMDKYKEAARLDPKCLECAVQLGWIYSKQARWPEAEGAYRGAVALDPENFDAQLGLGIALYSQQKPGDALPPLQKASELKPDSFEALYNLGLAQDGVGNPRAPRLLTARLRR